MTGRNTTGCAGAVMSNQILTRRGRYPTRRWVTRDGAFAARHARDSAPILAAILGKAVEHGDVADLWLVSSLVCSVGRRRPDHGGRRRARRFLLLRNRSPPCP